MDPFEAHEKYHANSIYVWNEIAICGDCNWAEGEQITSNQRLGLVACMRLVDNAMTTKSMDSKTACWFVNSLYSNYGFFVKNQDGVVEEITLT